MARVGEASLTVPAGSLEPGTVVLAQQLADPASVADLSVASVPGAVRFLADGEVLGPLTVTIPVKQGVDAARILSAEEGSILWSDETTEVVDGLAVAEVDHLTTSVAAAPTVSNLSYTLFRLIGARTDVPECPEGPPPWVLDIISPARESLIDGDLPNAPLLPCGDRTREGDADLLALRVAANRGYSVVVRAPDVGLERRALRADGLSNVRGNAENALLTALADGLGTALRLTGVDAGGGLYAIPPLRTSEFLIADPLDGGPGFRMLSFETVPPLDPQALAFSLLIDMYSVALAQLGSIGLEDLAECVDATMAAEGRADQVDAALEILDACLAEDPEEEARAWLDLQRWFQRAKTPIQIGLLTVERAADMFNPDVIDIAVENARTGAGESAVPPAPTRPVTSTAMWRGDASRSGSFPAGAPSTEPDVLWQFRDAGAELVSSPIAADGRVHLTTRDGQLITVDLATGDELWRFSPPGGEPLSTPAVTEGVVVIHADGSGVVHGLDATTGVSRWRTSLRPATPSVGDIFVADGRVIVATSPEDAFDSGGQVDVLRVSDGRIESTVDPGDALWNGAAAVDGEALIVGGSLLSAFMRSGGSLLWNEDNGDGVGTVLSIGLGSGRIYTTRSMGGYSQTALYAFDLSSGALLWEAPGPDSSLSRSPGTIDLLSAPAIDAEAVYVGGWLADEFLEGPAADSYGVLFAFEQDSGAERWATRLPGAVIGAPAVSGDVLVVATYLIESDSGQLHGIDRETGLERWRIDLAGRTQGAFPIGDVLLVVESGALTALR